MQRVVMKQDAETIVSLGVLYESQLSTPKDTRPLTRGEQLWLSGSSTGRERTDRCRVRILLHALLYSGSSGVLRFFPLDQERWPRILGGTQRNRRI